MQEQKAEEEKALTADISSKGCEVAGRTVGISSILHSPCAYLPTSLEFSLDLRPSTLWDSVIFP